MRSKTSFRWKKSSTGGTFKYFLRGFFMDLFGFKRRKNQQKNQQCLAAVLERANNIVNSHKTREEQKLALRDFINVLLRPLLWSHIRQQYLNEDHKHSEIKLPRLFDIVPFEHLAYDPRPKCDDELQHLNLGNDCVFVNPWRPSSLNCMLGTIGHGNNPFKQREDNHDVSLLMPMRIGYVWRGNHSIMQGMLTGSGKIIPCEVINCSQYFDRYSFDGTHWVDHESDQKVEARYIEFGWVWEICKAYQNILQ